MTKTLHGYLGRDLVKTSLLALVVSTLIFTVLAIVEPLRKQGLASGQVGQLILYTIPVMLSFTLPVATLFAATIVYGRFSQDNELTACRASGVSTLSVLKPALFMGVIVTICSLLLSNLIVPRMAELLETEVKENAVSIVSQKLGTLGYYRDKGHVSRVVHADAALRAEEGMTLYGVVGVEGKEPSNTKVLAATEATVQFVTPPGTTETFVMVNLVDPLVMLTGEGHMARESSQPLKFRMVNPTQDDPNWYDWGQLMEARSRPQINGEVRVYLDKIRGAIITDKLMEEVADGIGGDKVYKGLSMERQGALITYWITAPQSEFDGSGVQLKSEALEDGRFLPVAVTVFRDGRKVEEVTASAGRISIDYRELEARSVVSVKLTGSVIDRLLTEEGRIEEHRRPDKEFMSMPIPPRIQTSVSDISDEDLIAGIGLTHRCEQFTGALAEKIRRVYADVVAEIHMRLAFGMSCFLMVALGAALGLVFRGGQVITAFVLTIAPATLMFSLVSFGSRVICNPKLESAMGVGVLLVWSGIIVLGTVSVGVYWRLCRQ